MKRKAPRSIQSDFFTTRCNTNNNMIAAAAVAALHMYTIVCFAWLHTEMSRFRLGGNNREQQQKTKKRRLVNGSRPEVYENNKSWEERADESIGPESCTGTGQKQNKKRQQIKNNLFERGDDRQVRGTVVNEAKKGGATVERERERHLFFF